MIISIEEARQYIDTDVQDSVLAAMLQALELAVRKYTNNNFQDRNRRYRASIVNGNLPTGYPYILSGDTIQISESQFNDGLYVYSNNMNLIDEDSCLVTKIVYPFDVKMGAVNMLKWDLENRSKVGIQSETISRHSVTYFNMDGDNSTIGYPKSLIGFLKPYIKARF